MKIYDFNKPVDRRGSHCIKYDALNNFFGRDDLLPLWVADMDFETPDFIIEAMLALPRSRTRHSRLTTRYRPSRLPRPASPPR